MTPVHALTGEAAKSAESAPGQGGTARWARVWLQRGLLAVVAFLVALLVFAQARETAERLRPQPGWLVPVSNEVFLGEGLAGVPIERAVPLFNRGDTPVTVLGYQTSCGCLRPTPETPFVVAAGGREYIRLGMTLENEGQQKVATVSIRTDAAQSPSVVLRVLANAKRELLAEPSSVSFGDVPMGTTATRTLRVRTPDGAPWPASRPLRAKPSADWMEVQPIEGENGTFAVSLAAARPGGLLQGTIQIGPIGESRQTTVAVNTYSSTPLTVAPDPLSLRDGAGTLIVRWTVTGRSNRFVRATGPDQVVVTEDPRTAGQQAARLRLFRVRLPNGAGLSEGAALRLEFEGTPSIVSVRLFKG